MNTEEINYIPPLIFIFLIVLTYYTLGMESLISNILLLSFYSLLVPSLFFTYGAYIEKLSVEDQVDRMVDEFTQSITDLGYTLPSVSFNIDKSADDEVKKENNKYILESFLVSGSLFVVGFIIAILLWKYSKVNFNFKHLLYKTFFLLFLVFITELFFIGMVSGKYRAMDSNVVKKNILVELANKYS